MNILCLGSEVIGAELATDLIRAFLAAEFRGKSDTCVGSKVEGLNEER